MSDRMKKVVESVIGQKSTPNTTSTKGSTMKTVVKKPAGKGPVKKSTPKKKAAKKATTVVVPVYTFDKFKLPTTITGLKSRVGATQKPVKVSSMEHGVQLMIAAGYPEALVVRIFRAQVKWATKDDMWIAARAHKYLVQERNLMEEGHIVDELHPVYQKVLNRRKASRKAAATRKAKATKKA